MFATVSVDRYSFPSGHTTRVAALAVLAPWLGCASPACVWIIVWAVSVAVSRVVLGAWASGMPLWPWARF